MEAGIGLGIAGLVLSLFPVIVAGVDAYKSSTLSMTAKKLSRSLSTTRIIYKHAIEKLLVDVGEGERLPSLLGDPGGSEWSHPVLVAKLKKQLGEAYVPYLETIEDIKDIIEELQTNLGLVAAKPSQHKIARFIKEFTIRPFNEAGLDQLRHKVNELDRLTAQTSQLAPARSTRGLSVAVYRRVRDTATHLYTTLSNGWSCNCETHHLANLLLETRTPSSPDKPVRFRFLFSFRTAPDQEEKEEDKWRELEIRLLTADQLRARTPIDNLCEFIINLKYLVGGLETCVGYLKDKQSERYYGLFTVPEAMAEDSNGQRLPLAKILSPLAQQGRRGSSGQQSISRSTRVRLAVILSSTMLQLHSTPWLDSSWTKDQIWCAEADTIIQGRRPYLRRKFWSENASSSSISSIPNMADTAESGHTSSLPWMPNEDVYNLGIILIELAFAKNMDEIAIDVLGDVVYDNNIELRTVVKVLSTRMIATMVDSRYHRAVYSCIYCNFDLSDEKMKFEDEQFQENILNKIVRPLESYLECFPRI